MISLGKFSVVIAAAVLAAGLGYAQAGNDQTKTIVITPSQWTCPVGMQAQHAPGLTAQIPVDKNGSVSKEPVRREGQHLQLTLNNTKTAAISAVRVRVRGWNAKAHTIPAQKTGADYTDASQVLELKVDVEPHATAKTDVWVRGMTAVDSIDLIGVRYADGTSWRPAVLQVCSVLPDPGMLISTKSK